MGYQDFIGQYGDDGKVSKSDVKDFLNSGGSKSQAEKYLKKAEEGDKGYDGKVGSGASNYLSSYSQHIDTSPGPTPDSIDGGSGGSSNEMWRYGDLPDGMSPAMFDRETGERLATIYGNNEVNVQNAIGANNVLVQQLISDSNDYANQLNLEGVKYSSDRNYDIAQYQSDSQERWRKYLGDVEAETAKAVQTLRNQGALDLQAIVNTGLTDVADIQGAYASERVQLQGEYDVERANIQSDFEKFKAARAKEGQMYGSLMAGFWS